MTDDAPLTIPAVTLWQPWASLIASGAKPFETRAFPIPARLLGKRVAIHAAARACFTDLDAETPLSHHQISRAA